MSEELIQAMVELEESKTYELVRDLLEKGTDAKEIIEILRNCVEIIGDKFNKKEYFLT